MVLKLQEIESNSLAITGCAPQQRFMFLRGISCFVVASLVYLGINVFMAHDVSSTLQVQPKDYPDKDDIYWTMHHYMASKNVPEVFF